MTIAKILKCELCLKPFKSTDLQRRFCSVLCSSTAHKNRKILECLYCFKKFEVMGYMALKTKYCSRECSSKDIKLKGILKVPESEKNVFSKKCNNCQKDYKVWGYRKEISKYCSTKCRYETGRISCICSICKTSYEEEYNVYCNSFNVKHKCKNCRELNSTSSFELDVRLFLKQNGFKFSTNQAVAKPNKRGYVYPDIVCGNIIIECNGDFFHCNPEIYSSSFINPRTLKTAQEIWDHDKYKRDLYMECGYNVIVVWESKWKNQIHQLEILNILKSYENNPLQSDKN